jgi:hypothetical protein
MKWETAYEIIDSTDSSKSIPTSSPSVLRLACLIPQFSTSESSDVPLDPILYIHCARTTFRVMQGQQAIPLPSVDLLGQPMSTAGDDTLSDIYTLRLAMLLGIIEKRDLPKGFQRRVGECLGQVVSGQPLSLLQSTIVICDRANERFCSEVREFGTGTTPLKRKPPVQENVVKGEGASVRKGGLRRRTYGVTHEEGDDDEEEEEEEKEEEEENKENKRVRLSSSWWLKSDVLDTKT